MRTDHTFMGLFQDEAQAAAAIGDLTRSSFRLLDVHSPFPSHHLADALKLKKSKVGYFTLAGGIIGLIGGFCLAIYCAVQWNLIVGGKPVIALIPFIIVGFECTILFAVFGNVIGMLTQMRLPDYGGLKNHDPRCSGGRFGVLAACREGEQDDLLSLFHKHGARVEEIR